MRCWPRNPGCSSIEAPFRMTPIRVRAWLPGAPGGDRSFVVETHPQGTSMRRRWRSWSGRSSPGKEHEGDPAGTLFVISWWLVHRTVPGRTAWSRIGQSWTGSSPIRSIPRWTLPTGRPSIACTAFLPTRIPGPGPVQAGPQGPFVQDAHQHRSVPGVPEGGGVAFHA